jgi:hypothetical protein
MMFAGGVKKYAYMYAYGLMEYQVGMQLSYECGRVRVKVVRVSEWR